MKRFLIGLLMLIAASQSVQSQIAFRPLTSYSVTISSTGSTATAAVGAQTRIARVICTISCYVAFPLTTIGSALSYPMALPPNTVDYIKITPGSYAYTIALSGTLGTVFITEVE